jgi:hypothetical protein
VMTISWLRARKCPHFAGFTLLLWLHHIIVIFFLPAGLMLWNNVRDLLAGALSSVLNALCRENTCPVMTSWPLFEGFSEAVYIILIFFSGCRFDALEQRNDRRREGLLAGALCL